MAIVDRHPLHARIAVMKVSVFSRLSRLVRPPVVADALIVADRVAWRGPNAPLPRSADSDGRLRRMRQLVEDNRLL